MTQPSDFTAAKLLKLAGGNTQPRKAKGSGDSGNPAAPPPEDAIAIKGGSIHLEADAAIEALLRAEAPLYQHGARLVRIGRSEPRANGPDRAPGSPILLELSTVWLVDDLTRRATWVKFDKRSNGWIQINAPRNVAETILARAGNWPFLRLTGFIEAPCFLPDGRLVDAPGYDMPSGLYLLHQSNEVAS